MHIDNDSHYNRRTPAALVAGLTLSLIACTGTPAPDSSKPVVIATTSILGDVVSNVGGDAIDLVVMIPPGVDPHDFAPSAQQVAAISGARLVVANGLGLEEGLEDLLTQAQTEGITAIELAEALDPLALGGFGGTGEGGLDPHFWQDPIRMKRATELITTALTAVAVPEAVDNGSRYEAELDAAHAEIESILSSIPLDRRVLVTNHDAFGYFADRYGFTVIGTVIPGGSTLAGPSSAQLATLVKVIDQSGVPAIFVENIGSQGLAHTVAAEVGRRVEVVQLSSDALGEPGSETGTYIDLLLFNARAIADALGG